MRVLWIAIVVLAALLPIAPIVVCSLLVAALLFAPDASARSLRIDDSAPHAQSLALLAVSLLRAPPARLV